MHSSKSTTKQKCNTKDELLLDAANSLSSFKISELIRQYRYDKNIIQKALIAIMDKNENPLLDPKTEYGGRFFCAMSLLYQIDRKTPRNLDRKCIYEAIKKGILSINKSQSVSLNDPEDPLLLKNNSLDDGRLKVIDYFLLKLYDNKLNQNDKEALLGLAKENKNQDAYVVFLKYFKDTGTSEFIKSVQQHPNSFPSIYQSENNTNNDSAADHSEKEQFEILNNNNLFCNSGSTFLHKFNMLNTENNEVNQPDLPSTEPDEVVELPLLNRTT